MFHSDFRIAHILLALSLLLLLGIGMPRRAVANPSTISYIGQLLSGGTPVTNGSYDFQFSLYTAVTGGSEVNSPVSLTSIPVADGVFYVEINLGSTSTGTVLYLQTAYRRSGTTTYTIQSPRKLIPTDSYADYAAYSGSTHALYSRPINPNAPTTGQVLTWDGSLWSPKTPPTGSSYTAGTGLTLSGNKFLVATGGITNSLLANGAVSGSKLALPLSAGTDSDSTLFSIYNNGHGAAITGNNTEALGNGIVGIVVESSGVSDSDDLPSGLWGDSDVGNGVVGTTAGTGANGVEGTALSGNGGYGVYGSGDTGIFGTGTDYGVYGSSSNGNIGIFGTSSDCGVYGNGGTYGVFGTGTTCGVHGYNTTSGCEGDLGGSYNSGIFGQAGGSAEAILGVDTAANGRAIEGDGDSSQSSNYAGIFFGNVYVSGTLSKAGGSFKIDDPLDPAHKYLSHSFVESPDMMNIYNGNITTNASGNATVTMPDYFEALNQDFRYQLTVIGQFAQAIVGSEMEGSQFTIKTDKPNVKVYWQVTGIRHDVWANSHRIPVEEDKPDNEQGLYLNPKEFGLADTQGIFQKHRPLPGQPLPPVLHKPGRPHHLAP